MHCLKLSTNTLRLTMNKNQSCQENFLKIKQGYNKNQSCLKKIEDRYNKNQGCLEKIEDRYKKLRLIRKY